MDDKHDEPAPEIRDFLRGRATQHDRSASPITPDDAVHRVVPRSIEPRRWSHAPAAMVRSGRGRPAVAAAVIAALLIGALGGFAVGRGASPQQRALTHGAARDTTTPTVVSQGGAGAVGGGAFTMPQVTRLFIRATSEGIALRGYLQSNGDIVLKQQSGCLGEPGSWCPPPECMSPDSFMAEVSSPEAVMQTGAQDLPMDGPAASRGGAPLGQMEGAPVSVWMIQTRDDVASVRATWADGFGDEMAPVNGWVLVAHTGAAEPTSMVATLRDGSTFSIPDIRDSPYPAQCQPPPPAPPELPPAGKEQPDDPEAARAAITNAYTTVFTHGSDPTTNAQYMEDAENLQKVAADVKSRYPEATDTVTVEIGEIRFLSKTDAALYFELKYQGGALFGKQVGYAKLVDGTWKIARDTSCMVFSWGGGQCDPPPDPARSSTGATPTAGAANN